MPDDDSRTELISEINRLDAAIAWYIDQSRILLDTIHAQLAFIKSQIPESAADELARVGRDVAVIKRQLAPLEIVFGVKVGKPPRREA